MKIARDWPPLSPFIHGVLVVNRWSAPNLLKPIQCRRPADIKSQTFITLRFIACYRGPFACRSALFDFARKRYGNAGRFIVGDAAADKASLARLN